MRTRSMRSFEDFMNSTYKRVYRFLLRLTGNPADAEDFTQEAFIRAYRAFETQKPDRSCENWVTQIAYNAFLDHCRQRGRRPMTISMEALRDQNGSFDAVDSRPSPEESCLRDELSEPLANALSRLTPMQFEIIRLADLEGVPYRSIASHVGCSFGTVKSRLHRARVALKKHLYDAQNQLSTELTSAQACA